MPRISGFHGPLRVSTVNPRYFTDDSGVARYLTGSHTWATLLDVKTGDTADFDYGAFLDMVAGHGHTFIRMWTWDHPETTPWTEKPVSFGPMPFARAGPGDAVDGKPRFDLSQWNQQYFDRLRERVSQAGQRGLYVSVMLFEGWCLKWAIPDRDPWQSHPYNRNNNVNGVDGDPDNDGKADVYGLVAPEVLHFQEGYVRKVLDTLNDLDNVLYEIINEIEDTDRGVRWQYHMIDFIHAYEATLPKQHPVGMTAEGFGQDNEILFHSAAEWVSPGAGDDQAFLHDPPDTKGRKVVVTDTDHLWGHGGTYRWAWKSFLRGLNPIFMDPWGPLPGIDPEAAQSGPINSALNERDYPDWDPLRRSLGDTARFADRVDLLATTPRPDLASSGYCLAEPGTAYIVYVPEDSRVVVDLGGAPHPLAVEWYHPPTGKSQAAPTVDGSGSRTFVSPFGLDSVLFLSHEH